MAADEAKRIVLSTAVRLKVEQLQLVSGGGVFGLFVMLLKHLQNGRFFENRESHYLQKSVKAGLDAESSFCYCHQHVNAYGDPDLRLDSIRGVAEEALDPEMLFDPFEEHLYAPAILV